MNKTIRKGNIEKRLTSDITPGIENSKKTAPNTPKYSYNVLPRSTETC